MVVSSAIKVGMKVNKVPSEARKPIAAPRPAVEVMARPAVQATPLPAVLVAPRPAVKAMSRLAPQAATIAPRPRVTAVATLAREVLARATAVLDRLVRIPNRDAIRRPDPDGGSVTGSGTMSRDPEVAAADASLSRQRDWLETLRTRISGLPPAAQAAARATLDAASRDLTAALRSLRDPAATDSTRLRLVSRALLGVAASASAAFGTFSPPPGSLTGVGTYIQNRFGALTAAVGQQAADFVYNIQAGIFDLRDAAGDGFLHSLRASGSSVWEPLRGLGRNVWLQIPGLAGSVDEFFPTNG